VANTAAITIALVALVAWSAWLRWQTLDASPFPLGVDGYFYPIQIRSLLEHGTLQYPAAPMTFWWMAPFAVVTDPITGAKLGAAIGCALVALPAYGVAAHLTRERGAGLVAAAVAAMAATSAYVTIEFVKQGLGLTVGLTALWLVLRALAVSSKPRIALAIAAVAATALTHKLAAGYVLVLALPAAIEEARGRAVLRGRRLLYLLVALTAIAIVVLVLGLVAPQRFLSPSDLALVGDLVTSKARWDGAALATHNLTLVFGNEATIAGVLAILAAVVAALRLDTETPTKRSAGRRVVLSGIVALGVVIALPWLDVADPQGLAFRLRVTAFVPLALCGAIVAAAIARRISEAGWQRTAALAAVALVIVVAGSRRPRIEGRVLAHPAMVSAVMAATPHIPAGTTVIVPERHIMFMTAWYTRAPVSLRPDAIPYGRRVRLLPLAFIGMGSPLDEAIDAARRDSRLADPPLGVHPRHRNGLVLVTEPTWDYLLASLPAEVRTHWARWTTI
jgi:hypothetical protein